MAFPVLLSSRRSAFAPALRRRSVRHGANAPLLRGANAAPSPDGLTLARIRNRASPNDGALTRKTAPLGGG